MKVTRHNNLWKAMVLILACLVAFGETMGRAMASVAVEICADWRHLNRAVRRSFWRTSVRGLGEQMRGAYWKFLFRASGLPMIAGGATIRLSEELVVDVAETADIGATNTATIYADMKGYDRIYCIALLSATWNAADGITTFKLQQATSSAGASVKDLTTSGAGVTNNYNSTAKVVGAGVTLGAQFLIAEARAEDIDSLNSFRYVRGYIASTDNTGVDNVTLVLIRASAQHSAAQLQGAAVSALKAYITPTSAGGFTIPV